LEQLKRSLKALSAHKLGHLVYPSELAAVGNEQEPQGRKPT
jgi:hypothetical protein